MANQTQNPDGKDRMVRINLIGSEGSKPERNGLSGRRPLCAGETQYSIRLDSVSGKAANLSITRADGETETLAMQESETKDGISIGKIAATIVASGTLMLASCTNEFVELNPDADAGVCGNVTVSTYCDVDTPNEKVCRVNAPDGERKTAVGINGFILTLDAMRDGELDISARDLLQGCEPTGEETTLRIGEPVTLTLGGDDYEVSASSISLPYAKLGVRKVDGEPPVTEECPAVTDRCEGDGLNLSCLIYDGTAAELDGYRFKVSNIHYEYPGKAFDLEIYDARSPDCRRIGLIRNFVEGHSDGLTLNGSDYGVGVDLDGVDVEGGSVRLRVYRTQSLCENVLAPRGCETGTDYAMCEVRVMGEGIEMDGILFMLSNIRTEGGELRVEVTAYDMLTRCNILGGRTINVPGVSETLEVGLYGYNVVAFSADPALRKATLRVNRIPLPACEGVESAGPINVGEWIESYDGMLKFRLDDVTRDEPLGAILTVLDRSDREVGNMVVRELTSEPIEYGGKIYSVRADEVAVGVMLLSKWARLSVTACGS